LYGRICRLLDMATVPPLYYFPLTHYIITTTPDSKYAIVASDAIVASMTENSSAFSTPYTAKGHAFTIARFI
jgi:hypothetical protein